MSRERWSWAGKPESLSDATTTPRSNRSSYSIGRSTPGGLPCVRTLPPISPSAVSNRSSGPSSSPRPTALRRRWMDRCMMSSPSSSSEKVAWNSKVLRSLPIGLKAGEGFLDSRVVGEHLIERRQLEHHACLLVGRGEAEVALAAPELLQRSDDRTQARRVDKAHPLHVDDDALGAVLLDRLRDGLLQGRGAGQIEPSGGRDHGHAVVGLAGLHLECHSRKSIWQLVGTLASLDCMAVTASADAERVLVVDDEEALAKSMARVLRSRGFESDVAFSAAEARKLLEDQAYAIALVDVRLPDESGYGLLEELRATRPDTAVVMISGVDDLEPGRAALELGAFAYHVKPVGSTQLYLLVVNNLRRRRLELDHRANLARLEGMVAERHEQIRRAAELQAGMLPASPFTEGGFQLAAHFTAAREISGDFYDWYRAPGGRVAVTLGDVMGNGVQASLMMATARAVNDAYVTVFHLTFDPPSGRLDYVDAGHGHARLLRGERAQELLGRRSAPIGMFPDTDFVFGHATLEPGDSVVVFSDGLLDLRPDLATKEVQLPYEARRAASAQEMVDILAQGARNRELLDDVTVVALRRL